VTENDQQLFSEEAALRELEDLQRAIEQSRARRKDANDAFDRFLRSFDRQAAPPPPPAEPVAPPPALPPVAPPPVARIEALPPKLDPASAPIETAPPRVEVVSPRVDAVPPVVEVATPPVQVAAPPVAIVAEPTVVTEPAIVPVEPAASEDLTPLQPEPDDTLIGVPVPSSFRSQPLTWPPSDLPPHPEDEVEPEAEDEQERTATGVTDPLQLDAWERQAEPSGATAAFPAESDVRAMTEATLPRETRAVPAALRAPAPRSSRRISPAVGVLAVLVIGAAAFFVWQARSRDPGAATETGVAQPQPAAVTPQVAPPAPAPAAPAPPAAEVSTVRKVWVRVLVDGQKVLERELPADAHIPLTPTSQVVVRAGDAGAVRVSIAGKDQGPVGRDGEVATRAFPVATPAVR
jgi:hypothetical protein